MRPVPKITSGRVATFPPPDYVPPSRERPEANASWQRPGHQWPSKTIDGHVPAMTLQGQAPGGPFRVRPSPLTLQYGPSAGALLYYQLHRYQGNVEREEYATERPPESRRVVESRRRAVAEWVRELRDSPRCVPA